LEKSGAEPDRIGQVYFIFQYYKNNAAPPTISLTITQEFHLGSILPESKAFLPIRSLIRTLKCLAFLNATKEPISHFDGSNLSLMVAI
jgi:hypothetical protein